MLIRLDNDNYPLAPAWVVWPYVLCWCGGICWLLLSVMFAIHATVIANSCSTCLLLQSGMLRDLPRGSEVDSARARLIDFEQAEGTRQLRLPFWDRVRKAWREGKKGVQRGKGEERGRRGEDRRGWGDGLAAGVPLVARGLLRDHRSAPYHWTGDGLENFALNENREEAERRAALGVAGHHACVVPAEEQGSSSGGAIPASSPAPSAPASHQQPPADELRHAPPRRPTFGRARTVGHQMRLPGMNRMDGVEAPVCVVPEAEHFHVYTPAQAMHSERNCPGKFPITHRELFRGDDGPAREPGRGPAREHPQEHYYKPQQLGGRGPPPPIEDKSDRFCVPASHLDQYRSLQKHWQTYDAYARVSMLLGTKFLCNTLVFYSISTCYQVSPALCWGVAALFLGIMSAIAKLDFGVNRAVHMTFDAVILLQFVAVGVASTLEYRHTGPG